MTWNAYHRRGDVLNDIIATLDARTDGDLPMDLPGVAETFTGEVDVLSALTLKWNARIGVNIEKALHAEPMDLEAAVAAAWRETCEQLPGIRRAIDRYTEAPTSEGVAQALALAHEKEWVRLALAAGLANYANDAAAAVGQRVESRAREGFDLDRLPVVTADRTDEHSPSLVERIRAFVA